MELAELSGCTTSAAVPAVHLHPGMESDNCLHQRNVSKVGSRENARDEKDTNGGDPTSRNGEDDLTLMEELLLIVMDPKGFVSIWNDHISRALRGCILIELWMRGKIELEPAGLRRKCFSRRAVVVKNTVPTEDCILNEALKIIKGGPPMNVADWIAYLCGETWNPLKLKFHMRLVRDRLFKELVERGILSTSKTSYWLMDVKSHPLRDFGLLRRLLNKVREALLEHYTPDLHRVDKRTLSLLITAHYSGGVENCLSGLSSEMERLAMKRMQELESTDYEEESRKGEEGDLHWAVYAALNDPYIVI